MLLDKKIKMKISNRFLVILLGIFIFYGATFSLAEISLVKVTVDGFS